MSFGLYELALHPKIQRRLRAEITQVLGKHNGELTYDGMQEMSYLDMVVSGKGLERGYTLFGHSRFCAVTFHRLTLKLTDEAISIAVCKTLVLE
jgi:hypothetical protein